MLDFDFKKRHMKEEEGIALMQNNKRLLKCETFLY